MLVNLTVKDVLISISLLLGIGGFVFHPDSIGSTLLFLFESYHIKYLEMINLGFICF